MSMTEMNPVNMEDTYLYIDENCTVKALCPFSYNYCSILCPVVVPFPSDRENNDINNTWTCAFSKIEAGNNFLIRVLYSRIPTESDTIEEENASVTHII